MTAPAAPELYCHTDGTKVYVRFKAVDSATDYKVYAGATINPTGLQDDIHFTEAGTDGWFQSVWLDSGHVYVRLTSLNVGAEESGYSNQAHLTLYDAGRKPTPVRGDPFE